MRGHEPAHPAVGRTFPDARSGWAKELSVGRIVIPIAEPEVGNTHVRFEERGGEKPAQAMGQEAQAGSDSVATRASLPLELGALPQLQ